MAGRRVGAELAVLTGLGVLLALLGPFGTFAMPWPWRLLDWLSFVLGGALFFRPVVGAAGVLARHGAMPLAAALACACLLAAFPTTILVAWCLDGMGSGRLTLGQLAGLYPEVLLVGVLATAAQVATASRRRSGPGATIPAAGEPGPPPTAAAPAAPVAAGATDGAATTTAARPATFLSRLPPALGRELLCLENEDHYVRAHTARGSALILMRLGDAVAELDGIEGMRTHRSWWVARAAVRGVVRRDRSVALALGNGIEVPVARAMIPALRQAGWLGSGDAEPTLSAAAPAARTG